METNERSRVLRAFSLVSTIGIQFALSTYIGYYAGAWLDNRFGTGPWLMVIGILAGVGAGVLGVIKLVNSLGPERKSSGGNG